MAEVLTITLDKPVAAVEPANSADKSGLARADAGASARQLEKKQQQMLNQQMRQFQVAFEAIQEAAAKINDAQQQLVAEHKQQIARLAVEIAEKILAQKIQAGEYEIEPIIAQALDHVPERQQVVVRLNPTDLEQVRRLNLAQSDSYEDVTFVGDSNVGQAQCRIESASGTIEAMISQQLQSIGKALARA